MAAAARAPAAHTSSSKLDDQAASAALYVSKCKGSSTTSDSILDDNGRLSSASAAASLKYAKPQELPSFPSAGLRLSSAGAAASIAESNKRTFEHWKPDSIPAASKAAMMAKDYEMDPLWQPEMSRAGSKAAVLAHREGPKPIKPPSSGKKSPDAGMDRAVPPDARHKALLAAAGAMSEGRRRADSAPIKPRSDIDNTWALNAATSSHRGATANPSYFGAGDPGFESARIQNIAKGNVIRQMYGSTPPVSIEVEEQNRQATLRASAIAMAKKMYAIQQSQIEEAKAAGRESDGQRAARKMHTRTLSDDSSLTSDEPAGRNQYGNLEEAARKLAMGRLAKIHDENAEYRQYYVEPIPQTRSRLSIRGRERASSDSKYDERDEEQSRKIRSQMSIFQTKLAEVDNKKRQSDREALMAVANKNVQARLSALDDKVFQETGKASPQQMALWEQQAREKAQADSDARMVNHGKVHIGGGTYMDQAAVDEIARARLQPTLDEISDKAEKQRARDEEIRLEHEKQKMEAEAEKVRVAEVRAEMKAARDAEKAEHDAKKAAEKAELDAKRATEKEEAHARKAEENARIAAEKQEEQARKAAEKERIQARRTEEKRIKAEEVAEQNERIKAEKEAKRAEKEEKRRSKDGKGRGLGALLGFGGTAAVGTGAAGAGVAAASAETGAGAIEGAVAQAGTADELREEVNDSPTAHFATTVDQPMNVEEPVVDDAVKPLTQAVDEIPREEPSQANATPEENDPSTAMTKARLEYPVGATETTTEETGIAPSSPKGSSKVKSWFKSRFRSSSKTQRDLEANDTDNSGFVGGVALTGAGADENGAIPEEGKSDSMREVAMVGRSSTLETDDMYGADEKPVSPINEPADKVAGQSPQISDIEEEEEKEKRGRKGVKDRFLAKSTTKEPTREDEDFEEARETFNEENLNPPPKLSDTAATLAKEGKSLSRERSKFTEDL